MTEDRINEYLERFDANGVNLGLERITELMAVIGNPEEKLKFIHITGTNGKGSTANYLASIIQDADYNVGLFTSPHLNSIRECLIVNDEEINNGEFYAILMKINDLIKGSELASRVTKFEILTAAAILWFSEQRCDIVVFEVGLGGATDSTNVIQNTIVSVFTPISLDHQGILGDSVEEIATIKAGIIKRGCIVVIAPQQYPRTQEIIVDIARSQGCKIKLISEHGECLEKTFEYQIVKIEGKVYRLSMLGEHQITNAMTAIGVVDILIDLGYNISYNNIERGLARTRVSARMEIIGHSPMFILDGGHNPDGIAAVARFLSEYCQDRRIVAVIGVLKDKDYHAMVRGLMPYINKFFTITPKSPRALFSIELAKQIIGAGGVAEDIGDIPKAIECAVTAAQKDGIILITGSLYYMDIARAKINDIV